MHMTFTGDLPNTDDVDGIAQLLRSSFQGTRINAKELATFIISKSVN